MRSNLCNSSSVVEERRSMIESINDSNSSGNPANVAAIKSRSVTEAPAVVNELEISLICC